MIAYEHFQKIRVKELIFIASLAVITALLLFISSFIFNPPLLFIVSLSILALGMNFLVYLIKKTGIATLFYLFTSIFTFYLQDIGVISWEKIITFLLAGILFEVVFLILKLEIHSLPLDMIIGTSISTASVPLIGAFLLSAGLASSFPLALINLIILAFAVGLGASVITFIIWYNVRNTKFIIKLESYLML